MEIKQWKIWILDTGSIVLFELDSEYYAAVNFRCLSIPRVNKRRRIKWIDIYSRAYQSYKKIPPEFSNGFGAVVKYIHEIWSLLYCD